MMTKITIKGKYTGANQRGVIIGGKHFINNGQVHTVLVDEKCYDSLVQGEKSGWFKIVEDNYDMFCISRLRPVPARDAKAVVVEAAPVVEAAKEVIAEVVEETTTEEVKEEKPKKKSSKKKD